MSDTFTIISSTNESVEIVNAGNILIPQPSFVESYSSVGDYGRMFFQKISLAELTIWISQYFMNYETRFYAEVPDPILEAHITLKNRMVQSLGRSYNSILSDREFNITYAPYMENQVLFPKNGEYMTFDIHPSEELLKNWSVDFPELEKFLDRKLSKKEQLTQLFGQHTFLNPEMEYVVRRILDHLAVPAASRALTHALSLELLAMFLLRSQDNGIPRERYHNRHTDALLHAREIIENEATTFDSEDLFSTEIQLADQVGLSIYQFKNGFKKLFGVNPYKMNLDLRLRKAQTFLRETAYSVAEIAALTGFRSSEGFIRAYKRQFRITPSMERLR